MSRTTNIRRQARKQRAALGFPADALVHATDLANSCARVTGLSIVRVAPPDPTLHGGILALIDPIFEQIYIDSRLPTDLAAVTLLHEFGHHFLHAGDCGCDESDMGDDGLAGIAQTSRAEGYSPRQRQEQDANVFAAELALPRALALQMFIDAGMTASQIAQAVGIPVSVAMMQLAESVLLPDAQPAAPAPNAREVTLDDSQRAAATATQGPLLIGAGPGTGKTKTLVARCAYLVNERGVDPASILALTYSRKAAQEMRERLIGAGIGTAAAGPWIGTIHSFGLEIVRRFGYRLGIPPDPALLDTVDAVALLETRLADLDLSALDNIYDPAGSLPDIVSAISRAKDELIDAERYSELVEEIASKEVNGSSELVRKHREVAHCYRIYEELKTIEGLQDYGDLIASAVKLLSDPYVAIHLRADFRHVLVDEYQDVNRASALMIKLLASPNDGLWVVGDHRQSIYQFRGASPANVASFTTDYPGGQRLNLSVNYRSQTPIVDLAAHAAAALNLDPAGQTPLWTANRGQVSPSCLKYAVADDPDAQTFGIARSIELASADGIQYRDMAVLCRTHGQAQTAADALLAQGIPVLYIGDILDRPEVRDVLCLMAVAAGAANPGLFRAGALPEYDIAHEDLIRFTGEVTEERPIVDILRDAAAESQDQLGLARLADHVGKLLEYAQSPRGMLEACLFEVTNLLKHWMDGAGGGHQSIQVGLVIHQLLAHAAAYEGRRLQVSRKESNRVLAFLDYLQRLRRAGASKRAEVPDSVEGLDAVRVMTVHAAKGLEFPLVFLPFLGASEFPTPNRGRLIPPLPNLAPQPVDDVDEDVCLFFVALSRARDTLVLSRSATQEGGRKRSPSKYIEAISGWLAQHDAEPERWVSPEVQEPVAQIPTPPANLPRFTVKSLDEYIGCPRRYYYIYRARLKGSVSGKGYVQMHQCVRMTLQQMREGCVTEPDDAAAMLSAIWEEQGPKGSRHEGYYKDMAEKMVRRAAGSDRGYTLLKRRVLTLTLTHCRLRVQPDAILEPAGLLPGSHGELLLLRYKTGKPSASHIDEDKLTVYMLAAQEAGYTPRVELRYLATGESVTVEQTAAKIKNRRAKYDEAAAGINAGIFPANPGRDCATCPFALVCPE